jgi:hypothetical protein
MRSRWGFAPGTRARSVENAHVASSPLSREGKGGLLGNEMQQQNSIGYSTYRYTSGAVIPGATVTITNNDIGIVTKGITTSTGQYVFGAVPPETYTLQVKMSGFDVYMVPKSVRVRAGGNSQELKNRPFCVVGTGRVQRRIMC